MACVMCGGPTKRNPNPAPRCGPCYRALMSERNRETAPERMRTRNPMRLAENRAKVSATLKAMGHQPIVRGGNGQSSPEAVRRLSDALGWPCEIVVRTGFRSGTGGLSNHYKLDIANEAMKIGIEVDGGSHGLLSRREQDQKKEAFLIGCGWTVLRFYNAAVMQNLTACVQMVASTISKLSAQTPTSPTDS